MRHTLIFALAAALAFAPNAVAAHDKAPSVRVAYSDLNLASKVGRARFDGRLAAAVKRVCPAADARDLVGTRVSRQCAAETHAKLEPAVASAIRAQAVALASAPSNALTGQ